MGRPSGRNKVEVMNWSDSKDVLRITKSFLNFRTEFIFVVNHKKGSFKLRSARKINPVGSFDIPKKTMKEFFPNIVNEAIEYYIAYAKQVNEQTVPRRTILQPKTGII